MVAAKIIIMNASSHLDYSWLDVGFELEQIAELSGCGCFTRPHVQTRTNTEKGLLLGKDAKTVERPRLLWILLAVGSFVTSSPVMSLQFCSLGLSSCAIV